MRSKRARSSPVQKPFSSRLTHVTFKARNSMKALRQTVDLSAYPDLVVIYLGMTVNMLTGIKRYLVSDPRLRALLPLAPMACFFTRISSTRCFRCMSGCANTGAILNRLNASHGQNPIVNGGSSFCKTLGGPASGTNSILHGAVLKRSTPMSSDLLAFSVLPKRYLRKEVYFQLASDCTGTEWQTHPRRILKQICRNR